MITFTLSAPTPSLNAGSRASGHWAARMKAKQRLQKGWAWDIALRLMPARPEPLQRARVTIYRHSVGTLDQDNAIGGCKALVDVLKPAGKRNPHGMGLIVDDTADCLELVVKQIKVTRRSDQRTVVTIEPLHVADVVNTAP